MTEAKVYSWDALESERPTELASRQRIVAERTMVSRIVVEPGFDMETHQHENEQITIVLSGRVRIGVGDPDSDAYREETLVAGQTIVLPSNVPHRAAADEHSVVLDLFSPPSETTGIDAPST